MKPEDLFSESHRATYCPEDDKLRLYVGRVPRDQYEFLRKQGWTSTPKQSEAGQGDFAAVWTVAREKTALAFAGIIEDEDAGPEERAADRAERFGYYRDKRRDEAGTHADKYEDPQAVGFQSAERAQRAAARQDRQGIKAVDAWSKAEYWQRRTAGVIANALYRSSPDVRMGRIKTLEAELRKREKDLEQYRETFTAWKKVLAEPDAGTAFKRAYDLANSYTSCGGHDFKHPRPDICTEHVRQNGTSLYSLLTHEPDPITGNEAAQLWLAGRAEPAESSRTIDHLKLRIAYEWQMLEAQGGRSANVEMEPGGWLGSRQIQKVNKSPATGRVVSVELRYMSDTNQYGRPWSDGKGPRYLRTLIKTERLAAGVYRPPTDEERAEFQAARKAEKAAAPKADRCPIINPTDADAERLQAALNAEALALHIRRHAGMAQYAKTFEPLPVLHMTQAQYSDLSKGSYAKAETRTVHHSAQIAEKDSSLWSAGRQARDAARGKPFCKVRVYGYSPAQVIILTDKPQKPFPAAVWESPAAQPTNLETVNA